MTTVEATTAILSRRGRGRGRGAPTSSALVQRPRLRATGALVVLVGAAVAANLWWLDAYRKGLPFSIDESGYLQRAVLYQQEISRHGFSGLSEVWRRPDIVAPLMPLVASVIRAATGATPFAMLGTVQIFYAGLIVASYFLTRHFVGRGWSFLTAAVVACLPGTIDASRVFLLAEPCAALLVALLAVQVRTRDFDSLPYSVAWGVLLGLASLTRTMVLALLIAPVAVGGVRLLLKASAICIRNAALGGLLALVIGGSWYWTSFETVKGYLTTFGYGKLAGSYGETHSVLSWSWWTSRLTDIVNQDVYAPVLLALLGACVVAAASACFVVARKRRHSPEPANGFHGLDRRARLLAKARQLAQHDWLSLVLVAVIAYLVLSTSENSGSYFELPLVPVLVCAVVVPVARYGGRIRFLIVAALVGASAITMVDQLNLAPGLARWSAVDIAGINMSAFNNSEVDFAGAKLRGSQLGGVYWSDCGGATISCFYGRTKDITLPYVKSWIGFSGRLVSFVNHYAEERGRQPVVFFAYQGPLLNTNTVALAAQLRGESLPIGALMTPQFRAGIPLQAQLENPLYGQPNIVLAGVAPASGVARSWPGSSIRTMRSVSRLLAHDGFHKVATLALPQAEAMGIWWLDR